MTIEAYVAELRRLLPRARRARALSEVEAHLRDAAARHRERGLDLERAEAEATSDFGPVEIVARELRAELAPGETRWASGLALISVASLIWPLYIVPENTLPPAPWTEKPSDVAALQLLTIGLWAAACGLALIGAVLAWTRWSRLTAPFVTFAFVTVVAFAVASTVLVERWFDAAPVTYAWPALASPLVAASLLACGAAAAWARRRRGLLTT